MKTRTTIIAGAGACALALLALAPASGALDPAHPESWQLAAADLYGFDAQGAQLWAVGYWGTLWISTDGGDRWEQVRTPVTETLYAVSFADAAHGWAVGAHGVILRSIDGGRSWTRQSAEVRDEVGDAAPLQTSLLSVSAVSAQEAWVVGDFGVVLHTRDGDVWEQVAIPVESFSDENVAERILNAVRFASPQSGYIAGEFGTLLRTSDGGATWTGRHELTGAPGELYLFQLDVQGEGSGAQLAAVGLEGTVLVSEDGGQTWQSRAVPTSAALFGVDWFAGGGVAVGDRGVIFTTADAGRSWQAAERARYLGWLAAVRRVDEKTIYAVGEGGVIVRSRDAGRTFELVGTRGSAAPQASVE